MSMQIGLFDETKVRAEVKRLAGCFDVTASILGKKSSADAYDVVDNAIRLYKETTSAPVGTLSADEENYLSFSFLRAAAKIAPEPIGWQSATEVVESSFETMQKSFDSKKSKLG